MGKKIKAPANAGANTKENCCHMATKQIIWKIIIFPALLICIFIFIKKRLQSGSLFFGKVYIYLFDSSKA